MKRCSGCQKVKPKSQFHLRSARPSGCQSNCKLCVSAREKRRYAADPRGEMERSKRWKQIHPRKARALAKVWYANNREKSLLQSRVWAKKNRKRRRIYEQKRRASRPAHFRRVRKAYAKNNAPRIEAERLRRQYGTTPDKVAELFSRQKGNCAICVKPFLNSKTRHIDHDHKTGVVRGLLCQRCNMALGLLDDSPSRLIAAAAYLEKA